MFYHIEGTVTEVESNLVVLDCGGVGYALNATGNTVAQVRLGEKKKLYVSESIGETNFDLYGFASRSEKHCFEMLIAVSGIGPKAALSILSYNTPEGLALAVMNNDEKALTVAPGIGKKIAQRVILELKDKVRREVPGAETPGLAPVSTAAAGEGSLGDAMAALTVLGYSGAEVTPVLRGMDLTGLSAEQIIKAVLRQMVK